MAHVCLSISATHTHTNIYLWILCGVGEERTFKGKRSSGDSGTCKDNFVGYSSTTITVHCHELVCMWLCHFMIIKVWCRACKNIFYFFNSLVFFNLINSLPHLPVTSHFFFLRTTPNSTFQHPAPVRWNLSKILIDPYAISPNDSMDNDII